MEAYYATYRFFFFLNFIIIIILGGFVVVVVVCLFLFVFSHIIYDTQPITAKVNLFHVSALHAILIPYNLQQNNYESKCVGITYFMYLLKFQHSTKCIIPINKIFIFDIEYYMSNQNHVLRYDSRPL